MPVNHPLNLIQVLVHLNLASEVVRTICRTGQHGGQACIILSHLVSRHDAAFGQVFIPCVIVRLADGLVFLVDRGFCLFVFGRSEFCEFGDDLVVVQVVILRRISPRPRCRIDIIAGHGGGDAGDHPGEVDGVGLQGGYVEVVAVAAVAAIPFGGHFAYGSAQCAAAAIVGFGCSGCTAGDGMGEFIGEGVQFLVAYPVRPLRPCGVKQSALQRNLQVVLQAAAVDGVVEGGAGGVVDEVFLQLGAEARLGVDLLHIQRGVKPLQYACGDHGRDERFDVLATAHVVQGLAEVALVVDEGDGGLVFAVAILCRLMWQPRKRIGLRGLRDGEAENEENEGGAVRNQFSLYFVFAVFFRLNRFEKLLFTPYSPIVIRDCCSYVISWQSW